MEHISQTLKNKKIKSGYFQCQRCWETTCYIFWDDVQKISKFRCTFCWKEDFLMNLASEKKIDTEPFICDDSRIND